MKTDLIGLIFEKVRIPSRIKAGLLMSYFLFKALDIEGRVERATRPKTTS